MSTTFCSLLSLSFPLSCPLSLFLSPPACPFPFIFFFTLLLLETTYIKHRVTSVLLFHMLFFSPDRRISWLQQSGRDPNIWNIRGRNATLVIANASYSHQGVYRCEASNTIRNQPYRVQSQEIRIDIRGEKPFLLPIERGSNHVTSSPCNAAHIKTDQGWKYITPFFGTLFELFLYQGS